MIGRALQPDRVCGANVRMKERAACLVLNSYGLTEDQQHERRIGAAALLSC
jgi:hypothetical protein